jgi:hypothetical protein
LARYGVMEHIDQSRDAGLGDQAIRRRRSVVMALLLAGLAVIFFITTIVRLGGAFALSGL